MSESKKSNLSWLIESWWNLSSKKHIWLNQNLRGKIDTSLKYFEILDSYFHFLVRASRRCSWHAESLWNLTFDKTLFLTRNFCEFFIYLCALIPDSTNNFESRGSYFDVNLMITCDCVWHSCIRNFPETKKSTLVHLLTSTSVE